jgi:putative membrane protein
MSEERKGAGRRFPGRVAPVDIGTPQRVSNRYMPVFLLRHSKAWAFLLLIYAVGPLLSGEAEDDQGIVFDNGFALSYVQTMLIVISVIIGLTFLFSYLSYRRIRWWVLASDVCIRKGILHRVDKRIPISRIQSVDITESLSERVFGVCTVAIDTAGGEGDDGKIPCLEKSVAAFLRDHLFALKDGVAASGDEGGAVFAPDAAAFAAPALEDALRSALPPVAPRMETIYKLPVKNLILTGVSNSKAFVFAFVIFGVLSQFFDVFSALFMDGDDVYESVWEYVTGLAVPMAVLFLLFYFVVSWAIAVLAAMAANFGFTVRNAGAKIEVERGLISHKTVSIEKARIQETLIRQGFIRRLIGYCEICVKTATLKLQSQDSGVSGGDEMLGVTVIHPFVSVKEVDYFLSLLLPDFADAPKEYKPLPKRAHLRSVLRWGLWTLFFEIAALLIFFAVEANAEPNAFFTWKAEHPGVFYVAGAAALAFFAFTGHLSYRARGLGQNDAFLSVRTGAWGREWSHVPRRKIQVASIEENPFQRLFGLATLMGTTGALGFPSLLDIDRTDGARVLEWVIAKEPGPGRVEKKCKPSFS